MWIRKEGAFTGVVPVATFMTAQEILAERSRKLTDQELLEHLKRLYAECGSLSGFIINQAMGRATASIYTQRFGSLSRAYQLVGFGNADRLEFMELNRRLRRHSAEVRVLSAEAGNQCKHRRHLHSPSTQHSVLSTMKTVLARCHTLVDKHGQSRQRWRIRFDPARFNPDLTVAIRLDAANTSELDYYLLPRLDLPEQEIRVSNRNSANFECFRFDNLNFFYGMSGKSAEVRGLSAEKQPSQTHGPAFRSVLSTQSSALFRLAPLNL